MNFIEELTWRGLINNTTNKQKIEQFIKDKGAAYIGFDPSFDSLHLGNYNMLLVLRRLKQHGHHAFAILGGATGQIGDPSGKKLERAMQGANVIHNNAKAIEEQIIKYSQAEVINNNIIYNKMSMFDFLRTIGKLVNVNYLLEKDLIKSRLETGISFTEFSYTLIQGYDFAWLYQHEEVVLQIGGSDQWGNITTGIEIIRKMYGDDNKACGLTINLLTKEDGTKFGKSEGGAIYLNPKHTPPFAMYQFLINQPDTKVEQLLKFLTFLDKSEIEIILQAQKADPSKRIAQHRLAECIITDIHGNQTYTNCTTIASVLYKGDMETLSVDNLLMWLTTLPAFNATQDTYNISDLLLVSGITKSKSDARRLIESKSISVNGKEINTFDQSISKHDAINRQFSYIKKGKKDFFLIKWA